MSSSRHENATLGRLGVRTTARDLHDGPPGHQGNFSRLNAMERSMGALAIATQSAGRAPVDEYGGYSRADRVPFSNTVRKGSTTTLHSVASNESSTTAIPLSSAHVIALAAEAMRNALEENQSKAAEASGVSNELKPGVTIDLSHKNIETFPDEVVEIIKGELERLALSHNLICTLPSTFSQCTSLRYLNVRNNRIREFPLPICELVSLEILDLGRNKLRSLPDEISKLTSLKVLSVQRNRIETLPLCLGDMNTLQVLKTDNNPITFPPKEILQPQTASPPHAGFLKESEVNDVAVTGQIKKFMKAKLLSDRSETESGGEESSEGGETPRPLKRVMSGRFPIKVNGTDVSDMRSPGMPRAPPIPSRSHYRGLSQQNAALRRPGVMPLTVGNSNERMRSNSESLLQMRAERTDKSDRTRRMGIVTKKPLDLGTVDPTKAHRLSHFRGLSHGSAMQSSIYGSGSRGPNSPADSTASKSTYVRRLSSLPERKRDSTSPDPLVEGAKGILFALFQVHPLIEVLIGLTRDGSNKRNSLERVFYNATTQLEELEKDVQAYDSYSEEDEEVGPRSNENVHSACLTCVSAYIHVCALLSKNVELLAKNGDPRYIRTFLLMIYGSLAEVRNAGASVLGPGHGAKAKLDSVVEEPLRQQRKEKPVPLIRERRVAGPRLRSATVVQHPTQLRVTTDARPPFSRSATMSSATPRSGESFASSALTITRPPTNPDYSDELFERIFFGLRQSSEMTLNILPNVKVQFAHAMRMSMQQGGADQLKMHWQLLNQKCSIMLERAEELKSKLSSIKLKEPGIRTQASFWELCSDFLKAYYNLIFKLKEVKSMTSFVPNDAIALLRQLQKAIKETGQLVQSSPWSELGGSSTANSTSNGTYSIPGAHSPAAQIPMTPASAALGPAVQATVPATPQNTSYNAMFSNNWQERADALLSMGNINSYRSATMSSTMATNDGSVVSSRMTSPMTTMTTMNSRYNGTGRMAI